MLTYSMIHMWKRLVSSLFRGVAILGIGIFLVITINSQTETEFVYASQVYGPEQVHGPTPETDANTFTEPACGVITSPFGQRWGRAHQGIDIGGEMGSPILAAKDGTVVFAGIADGYGNYLILDHGNGLRTAYAHCDKLYVSDGDCVVQGQQIATMGSTGNSTGPHLHFEIQQDGVFLNPQEYGLY
ncbi:MAG: M23 family metallopeptidase [Clostridia bacterium]|nr:M23 family metallopeptidase [Clostridia bacterium]